MSKTIIVGECETSWLYWWEMRNLGEKVYLKKKYFSESWPAFKASLLDHEKKVVWEQEGSTPLYDEEWLALASDSLSLSNTLPWEMRKEIWRQVYRIASQRI